MPVVLGHEAVGSSNIAGTQAMLYVKSVQAAVTMKLNELFSRLFTLAVRLYGVDAVVEFKYDSVDLRPESELEAFKAMAQSRVLEQLSLGLIDDTEASLILTGSLPVPGMKALSGTMFKSQKVEVSNPNSNTSALDQNLSGDAPKGVKSQNGSKQA
jgi:hypothetical protein